MYGGPKYVNTSFVTHEHYTVGDTWRLVGALLIKQQPVMLKDVSNANNSYVGSHRWKDQKPLTMAVEHAVSVVVRTKN